MFLNLNQNQLEFEEKSKTITLAQGSIIDQWVQETHEKDLIKNSEFDTGEDWAPVALGDTSDVNAYLGEGFANYKIIGDQQTFITKADPPTNTNWTIVDNPDFPTQPDFADFDEGCWVSHYWNEGPDQMISAHWEQNITMPVDMSDYIISSAEVNAVVNGTVAGNDGWLPHGGIEVPGDATDRGNTLNATYDYVRFYVLISDLNKNEVYEIAHYQSIFLGNDSYRWDNLTNTLMIPVPIESLKFYLSSVLKYDNYNFTISLGMRIWCEDNWGNDDDNWEDLRIKSFNLTFNYIKKINQFSSVSWAYSGDEISSKGGRAEVTEAILKFDYKTDTLWSTSSPNSEFKIIINDKEHGETVKLVNAKVVLDEIIDDGFDLTNLIPIDEEITVKIVLIIADEFGLANPIIISIDNVELEITYIIYLPTQQSFLFGLLLYVAIAVAGILSAYIVYYQRVLKYPKAVRKVRKYRKTLTKAKPPQVDTISRKDALKEGFNSKFDKVEDYLKTKLVRHEPLKGKVKTSKVKKIKNKELLILFFIISLLFLNIFLLAFIKSPFHTQSKEKTLILSQNDDDSEWVVVTNQDQWIENSEFEDDEGWDIEIKGDATDVGANIDDGEARFDVIGNVKTLRAASGTPNSSTSLGWKQVINPSFPSYPDISVINSSGCYVSHGWIGEGAPITEWADQSPSVHWDNNITMPVDMSDYIITSASLSAVVNASAETDSAQSGTYQNFGVEAGNDYDGDMQNATKDYMRFYILFSDLEKKKVYEVAYYQTTNLGQDTPEVANITDTNMIILSEEFLIFFLTSVLNTDNRHFTITLGIDIWCEDNYPQDQDQWNSLIIKSCNLELEYMKKINQATSVSWVYDGEQLEGEEVEVVDGELNFEYKIDKRWSALSPNSELRILINDELHSESFKLNDFEGDFEDADKDGLDVTELIPDDDEIELEIQLYIADEFRNGETYSISIDNVELDITYNVLVPSEQAWMYQLLLVLACIGIGCLAGYYVLYRLVLKYPKPVRKIRKYRKTLKRKKSPALEIASREEAIKNKYSKHGLPKLLKVKESSIQERDKISPDKLQEKKVFY